MTDTTIRPLPRFFGELVSVVFHPLFIPSYITAFLLYIHPFAFMGETSYYKFVKLLSVAINTCFFPAITTLLLKKLGFISSLRLPTRQDRIIPIIASMVFYFSIFYVSRNQADNPPELVVMLGAVFISSIIALTLNNFMKISLHGIAMGVMVGFFAALAWRSLVPMGMPFAVALIAAGLTGTARLLLGAHTTKELRAGFVAGVLSLAIATLVALP
ncbi:MAG: hypothetical protein QM664_00635 [Flavihumibacter sp.]